jgi:tRNA threonylcarbamoyladenosine modification (KEOPS) complex  Pcc1 subunit
MDLLSIASAAAAITVSCFKLGALLCCWIEEIRDVDGTLKVFMAEVNALSTVLDAVKSWSQDAVMTDSAQRQDSKAFWVLVQKTLEDCSAVIDQLDRLLTDIQSKRRFGQLINNFVLNLKSDNIALIRQQIQSYTTVLQMAMQVINV